MPRMGGGEVTVPAPTTGRGFLVPRRSTRPQPARRRGTPAPARTAHRARRPDNRPFSEPRLAVIAKTPALRERDLAKAAALTEAVAEALRQRDVPDRLAGLAAQTGWATFHHAAQAWIDDPSQSLDAHLLQAFDDLHALSATVPPEQALPES